MNSYEHLLVERRGDGVTLLTMNRPQALNAANARLHRELCDVWRDLAEDPETRVAVITGAGDKAFSAGGDLDEMVASQAGNFKAIAAMTREVRDLVVNLIDCPVPVISAINGVAVGAGLSVALLADVSVIGEGARLSDGHLRLGVAAGDHAAVIWPLLCGMARAKYYLLTADFVDGREAERIGLVSRCVPDGEVLSTALEIAERLAAGPQHALQFTKHAMNHWLRVALPAFDASLAYEMLTFMGEDVVEGQQAIRERRAPRFPSAC